MFYVNLTQKVYLLWFDKVFCTCLLGSSLFTVFLQFCSFLFMFFYNSLYIVKSRILIFLTIIVEMSVFLFTFINWKGSVARCLCVCNYYIFLVIDPLTNLYIFLSPFIIFDVKSILFDIIKATLAIFSLLFPWYFFFYHFAFSLFVSLNIK